MEGKKDEERQVITKIKDKDEIIKRNGMDGAKKKIKKRKG